MCDYIRYVRTFADTLRQEGKFWPKTTFDWEAAFHSLIIDYYWLCLLWSFISWIFSLLSNLFGFVMVQIRTRSFNILNLLPLFSISNRGLVMLDNLLVSARLLKKCKCWCWPNHRVKFHESVKAYCFLPPLWWESICFCFTLDTVKSISS
jgi:hypothetical protein